MTDPGVSPETQTATSAGDRARAFTFFDVDTSGQHPWPLLEELRAECPVAKSDAFGGYWVMTRYEDILRVFRDDRHFSTRRAFIPFFSDPVFGQVLPNEIDPPDHPRYRKLMAPFFSPFWVDDVEDKIRAQARKLLEPIVAKRRCDFVAEFTRPYPPWVFLPLLGLKEEELEEIYLHRGAGRLDEIPLMAAHGFLELNVRLAIREVLYDDVPQSQPELLDNSLGQGRNRGTCQNG